jgi:site-specific recombinase XerD
MQEAFASFLRSERGLAESSTHLYARVVRHFLVDCTRQRRPLSDLKANDITRYVVAATRRDRLATVRIRLWAIRWFLRFLGATGTTATNLAPAVPKVAQWRQADVPRFIAAVDVRRLLFARNPRSRSGSLDYAVLSVLARLGLRAGEVAAIKLEDLDWDTGELTVHGKGARETRVPLPVDVGRALARYLRHDRPHCSSRFLFLSPYAPHRPFTTVGISVLVRRAIMRAGLHTPTKGAHLLRHSLATHILRSGGSRPEIADLLRHRSIDTTTIYAKVDFKELRAIAPLWPWREA